MKQRSRRSLTASHHNPQSYQFRRSPWTSTTSCRWILKTVTRILLMMMMTMMMAHLRSVHGSFLRLGAPTSRHFLALPAVQQQRLVFTATAYGPSRAREKGGPRSSTTTSSSNSKPTSLQQHPKDREDVTFTDASPDPPSLPFLDPLIVCGPSGAGKGTLIHKYMTECGGSQHFAFGVSHTTRAPRHGETSGVHYHFVSLEEMQNLQNQNAFLECAHVHGNWYGTSWTAIRHVQSQGKRCLLDIDVQGVKRIQQLASSCLDDDDDDDDDDVASDHHHPIPGLWLLRPRYVFVAPPSLADLEQRLIGRGSESPETLSRRLSNAASELDFGLSPNSKFDAIVINADLDMAVQEFDATIRRLYDLDLDLE